MAKARNRVSLSTSRAFTKHQKMSVSLPKLQAGKKVELNEQVPIHPEIRSEPFRESTDLKLTVFLKGSAKRRCLYGISLEKEETLSHMEDSFAISSS